MSGTMDESTDYPAIRAWGRVLGSLPGYIEEQIRKARAANAPSDAIYETNAVWSTVRDITSPDTLDRLEDLGIDVSAARR